MDSATQRPQYYGRALAERHPEIPDGLPDDLVRTLAVLDGADPRAAQALLASLPFGWRAALVAYGLIDPISKQADAISPINITSAGWRVISACAEAYAPDERQERDWAHALEVASAEHREGRFDLKDGLVEKAWRQLEERLPRSDSTQTTSSKR